MDAIDDLTAALPLRLLEVLYETEILTLRAEREALISVRCPFIVNYGTNAELFPGGHVSIIKMLEGLRIYTIKVEARSAYPDLILGFEQDVRLSARPPHAGEEMWFIDLPGVAFISP